MSDADAAPSRRHCAASRLAVSCSVYRATATFRSVRSARSRHTCRTACTASSRSCCSRNTVTTPSSLRMTPSGPQLRSYSPHSWPEQRSESGLSLSHPTPPRRREGRISIGYTSTVEIAPVAYGTWIPRRIHRRSTPNERTASIRPITVSPAPTQIGAMYPWPVAITYPPAIAPRLLEILNAEWLRDAAIALLSCAVSMSRACITGLSTDAVIAIRKNPPNSPTGYRAVSANRTKDTISAGKKMYSVRRTLQSTRRPPMILPSVIPMPNVIKTNGTAPAGRPDTSVAIGATYEYPAKNPPKPNVTVAIVNHPCPRPNAANSRRAVAPASPGCHGTAHHTATNVAANNAATTKKATRHPPTRPSPHKTPT